MYISPMITSAVVVVLESIEVMRETNFPDTLFQNYDDLLDVLKNVIIPNREDVSYKTDMQNGVDHYESLYEKAISLLQKLIITEPHQVPIGRILIVFATLLQEKLNEKEQDEIKRKVTVDYIAGELTKRCNNLEQELIAMDIELSKTGKVEIFTI